MTPRRRPSRARAPELPLSDSPAHRLARLLPGAIVFRAGRLAVHHVHRDSSGVTSLVYAWQKPPEDHAWQVARAHVVIAYGRTEAEAVDRALFLWAQKPQTGAP